MTKTLKYTTYSLIDPFHKITKSSEVTFVKLQDFPSGRKVIFVGIHPQKLTWNLKRSPWKRRFLWKTIIFRFHVKLPGGKFDDSLFRGPSEWRLGLDGFSVLKNRLVFSGLIICWWFRNPKQPTDCSIETHGNNGIFTISTGSFHQQYVELLGSYNIHPRSLT